MPDSPSSPPDRRATGAPGLATARRPPDDLSPGTLVGPYRVVEEAGRGGMGTVYRAERTDGVFEQTVALKVVRRGMDSAEVLRRFEAERRILARLEHPGIARVLDGGLTDDGRPWLAMEFVEGEPITDHADDHGLGVDARLGLVEQVCEAVGYAHRRLVVHRDLKPSNVLVTPEGRVKLLDFGIARLLAADGAVDTRTVLTQAGQRVLTPAYAAPEQITGDPISTSADVYALGVLLYELLAGRRPHEPGAGTSGSLLQAVVTVDPPRPSAVVAERPPRTGSTPDRLRRVLAGDLDTICLMALRKEPERRYASAEALAEDLRRHRGGLPVHARPDTLGYRARTFARRHRAALAAAAVSVVAIGLVTALAFVRVSHARDRAEAEARTATEVSDFLADVFAGFDPAQTRGADVSARELLAAGTGRIRTDLAGQPEVQARMLHTIGVVYARLGAFAEAEAALEDALALRQRALAPSHPDVGRTRTALGELYERQGRYADAVHTHGAAVEALRASDAPPEALADALHGLALAEMRLNRVGPAERHVREAIALKTEAFGPRSPEVAFSMNVLGDVLTYADRPEEAEAVHLETLAIREETIGPGHLHTSHTYHNLAAVYRDLERWADAERFYREALRVQRAHYGADHVEVAKTASQLGLAVGMQGRFAEAGRIHERALAAVRDLDGAAGSLVAPILARRSDVLMAQGRPAEAAAVLDEGLRLWRASIPEPTPQEVRWLLRLSRTAAARGDRYEAARIVDESLALCGALAEADQRATCEAEAAAALGP